MEMIMGQLLEISIENTHSQSSQNQLRESAIEHYVKACEVSVSLNIGVSL